MTENGFAKFAADDPDLLESTALPKQFIWRLRNAFFTRLSDFDDMDDIQMLRQPGISRRIINAVRSERALIGIKYLSR